MNKKGFTLIELIVTIALLAVVAIISFISIGKVIQGNKKTQCESLNLSIQNATKSYVSDNRYNGVELNEITAKTLLDNNYLTKEIINPYTKAVIDPNTISITITLDSNYNPKEIIIDNWSNICK